MLLRASACAAVPKQPRRDLASDERLGRGGRAGERREVGGGNATTEEHPLVRRWRRRRRPVGARTKPGAGFLERRGDAMVSLQLEKKNRLENQPVIIITHISAIKQQSSGKSVGQEEEKDGIDRLCLLNDSLHRPDADRLITCTNHHVHVEFERVLPLIAKHERFLSQEIFVSSV